MCWWIGGLSYSAQHDPGAFLPDLDLVPCYQASMLHPCPEALALQTHEEWCSFKYVLFRN